MVRALKHTVVVQPGGRVEITSDELKAGQQAEVIILLSSEPSAKSYLALFGSGRGAFATPEEADAFLRRERDLWDS